MYLGLDIGTSAVKAVLVDPAGHPAGEAAVPLATARPGPGRSEQAPEDWWVAVQAAVARLERRGAVRAIGLSGQMHAALGLDARGRPIRPAILWNDGRAQAEAEALAEVPGFAARAGVVPMAGMTAPKLMWLKAHEPDSWGRIFTLLSVKDWIGFRLSGELVTDVSDAAGTLWLDQARRAWSARQAEASATDPAWLPPVLSGAEEAGRLTPAAAEALGLRTGIPIHAGAGDTVAGAVGVGAVRPGQGLLGLGTSGQILVLDDRCPGLRPGLVHGFAFTLPGLWYRMAAMLNGARPLAWFAGVAGRPLPELMAQAAQVRPEAAPLFLPYLTGERTPHGDSRIRGAFHGLADDTGPAEMLRGVVDAVAYSFADAAQALGGLPQAPVAVGGGAASDLLMQTLADVLGAPLHRPAAAATGAALGAARLAAFGDGGIGLSDLARPPQLERSFTPDPAAAARHAPRLARYRALYQALKAV